MNSQLHNNYEWIAKSSGYSLVLATCIAWFLILGTAIGQTPSAYYSFDNMDLSESTGNFADGFVMNTVQYDCGVGMNSSSLLFEGQADSVFLDPNVKELFDTEFTLSFYFRVDPVMGESYTLFSIEDGCDQDSSLIIRYLSTLNEIRIEYARDDTESVAFNSKLNEQSCWHHLVFIRDADTYSFYLNGEFINNRLFVEDVILGVNHNVHVGYSDCVPRLDDPFRGQIDEIQIFDSAFDDISLATLDRFPDQIISVDTTIFEGDSYDIATGLSCAPSLQWTPAIGLDNDLIPNPTATPVESVVYQVEFVHDNCVTTDSIRIFVLQDDDIDCDNLLLPTAFTPNGDNINDDYGISNTFIINDLQRYEIYDRWGLKIFESADKNEKWDGAFRDQNLMPGTYVYKIEYECRGDNFQKTGSFNLIK